MQRDFKFRVWDGVEYYSLSVAMAYDRVGVQDDREDCFELESFYENIIIEQFTSLKDKNGTEIYEGDIIKWRVFIFAVVWNEEYGCFGPSLKNGHDVLGKYLFSDKAEIIGNVHENPELLEKL